MNKEAWINGYIRGMQTNRKIAAGEIEKDSVYSKDKIKKEIVELSAKRQPYCYGYWTARLAGAR